MVDVTKLKNQNAENIRKIAKTKQLEDKLNEIEEQIEKNSIDAKRAIAYIDQTNVGGSKASGKTKETSTNDTDIETSQDGKTASEDQEAIEDAEDGKGTDAESGGGSGGINAADDGKAKAKELIDNNNDSKKKRKALALTVGGDGKLKAINGLVDCETGKEFEVRFNQPIKPPTGWFDVNDNEETPDTYEEGFFWSDNSLILRSFYPLDYATFAPRVVQFTGGSNSVTLTGTTGFPGSTYHNTGIDSYYTFIGIEIDPNVSSTDYTYIYQQTDSMGNPLGNEFSNGLIVRSVCTGTTSYCPADTPTVEKEWPEGIPGQLSYNNGVVEAAELDPNIPNKFKANNKSIINFCFDEGRFGRIEPTNDGGFMVMETSSYNGAPEGVISYFDSSGAATGFSDTTIYNFRKA